MKTREELEKVVEDAADAAWAAAYDTDESWYAYLAVRNAYIDAKEALRAYDKEKLNG